MVYAILGTVVLLLVALLLISMKSSRQHDSDSGNQILYAPDGTSRKVPTKGRLEVEAMLKIFGPITAILPILAGLIQFTDSQRERTASEARAEYIRATQLLTESGPSRPLAGIIAMSQLAENNAERTWLMTESLSAFIRHTAPRPTAPVPNEQWPSPYVYPPCDARQQPKDGKRSCTPPLPLYQRSPVLQAALNALGNRSRQNETPATVPRRIRPQFDAANPVLDRNNPEPHTWLRTFINREWNRRQRKETDDTKVLINEIQYPIDNVFPTIVSRPWLDLAHTSLAGAELRAPFFEGGNFQGADLSFSTLSFASLAKATLAESWIVGARLFHADLRGANLEHADVRGTDLGRADLRDAWMAGGIFALSNFWQANLKGAYLVAADFTEVETMAGARLDEVIAFRANFRKAAIAGSTIERVCMQRAFLKEAQLHQADLRGVDLRFSELQDADLSLARLRGVDLRGAELSGAKMDGADLSIADLRGVDFTGTRGVPSRLTGAIINKETRFPTSWPAGLPGQASVRLESSVGTEQCSTTERNESERNALVERETHAGKEQEKSNR